MGQRCEETERKHTINALGRDARVPPVCALERFHLDRRRDSARVYRSRLIGLHVEECSLVLVIN